MIKIRQKAEGKGKPVVNRQQAEDELRWKAEKTCFY